jgi:predicted acylesterase/phospholipase RssA
MKSYLLASAIAAAAVASSQDTCYAIALSGGGSNGAYEAGVLWGFLHYGDPEDFRYDVVSGVSAGSINSAAMSPWEIGDELAMTEWLTNMWSSITNPDVWSLWPGKHPLLDGIFKQQGILSDEPGYKSGTVMLTDQFPEGYKRRWVVAAVDANTGDYHVFNEINTPWREVCDAVISSSSIAGVFPPHHYLDTCFIDGGTVWNVNIDSAI